LYLFESLNQLIQHYLPEDQIKRLQQAYLVARDAHEGQTRSSGEPYITHPVAVACILAEMKLDYETLMAALLHDVIEDTPATYQDMEQLFGKSVAELVEGVSKLDKLKFRDKKEAQAENFRKMIMAMVQDIRVILIKLADRTHNMRTLGSLRPDKRRRIARETLEIYSPLAHRLGIHHIKTELEELGFEALYPNRYRVIKEVVKAARGNRKEMIQKSSLKLKGVYRKREFRAASAVAKTSVLHLLQNGAQRAAFSLDHGYLRVPRHRPRCRYLLSRAGPDAQPLQTASGSRQRLHRHSKSERLSIFAYLDDRPSWRSC
jgi:guanosine-3',5'-bis(diphosphate) 3'-pyrophosphohydrolase